MLPHLVFWNLEMFLCPPRDLEQGRQCPSATSRISFAADLVIWYAAVVDHSEGIPCLSIILLGKSHQARWLSQSWWQWRSQRWTTSPQLTSLNNVFNVFIDPIQPIHLYNFSMCLEFVWNVQGQTHFWYITMQYMSCSRIFNEINLCAVQRYPKIEVCSTGHNLGSGKLVDSIRWALESSSLEQVATGCGCTGYTFFGDLLQMGSLALYFGSGARSWRAFVQNTEPRIAFLLRKDAFLSCEAASQFSSEQGQVLWSREERYEFWHTFHSCETTAAASSIGH